MTELEKEKVEILLLESMRHLDKAISLIDTHQASAEFCQQQMKLFDAKREIKKVLNDKFDECARNNQNALDSLKAFNNSLKKNI